MKQKISRKKIPAWNKKGFLLVIFVVFSILLFNHSLALNNDPSGIILSTASKAHAGVSDTIDGCPVGSVYGGAAGCTTIGTKENLAAEKKALNKVTDAACNPLSIECIFKSLLLAVLRFFGWLLSAAAGIFAWAADAKSLTTVLNGSNIYDSWKIVRDLLNMSFIMVLLYVAFCSIFQIDSYSYKKRLLTIVLMALLVNFSFPISRFIIDAGNSLMYTIFKSLLPVANSDPSNLLSNIANQSGLGDILNGANTSSSLGQLLGSIIFIAILTITFLMMAILFVIRIVVLAIIIIFSPIAFVGAIVPGLSGLASKWWTYLFNQTFFGPAMAFMLFIAIKVMTTTIAVSQNNAALKAAGADPTDGTLIASMCKFAIPVVILWLGMGMAKSMGAIGADAAQKYATKSFKSVASAPYKAAGWGFNKTGIPGGLKQGWGNVRKTGKLFGANVGILKDNQANREAQIAGFMGGGPGGRSKALENKKGDEFRKKYKEESERYDSTTAAEIAKLIGEEGEIKDYASASKVSAMLHNLKSDSTKKEQFETNLRAQIIADNRGELNARDVNGNPRMSFEEKDVFIKQKMGQEWEKLNSKGREATNFALGKKQAPKTTA